MSSSGPPVGSPPPAELRPVAVPMTRIIEVGLALWAVALVVVLAVPALREGARSWWPWCCAAGLAGGLVGYAYVRRGRGNAAAVSGSPDA